MGEVLQKGTVFSQPKFLRKQPGFAHPTSRTDVLQVLMNLGNALVQRVVRGIRQYVSFDSPFAQIWRSIPDCAKLWG